MGDLLSRTVGGALLALLAFLLIADAAVTGILGGTSGAASSWACGTTTLADASGALPLDGEQTVNAATILDVARQLALPQRAAVIAIATALQESGLRNLDLGDRDSLGLFQQRPSQGWGDVPAGTGDHRSPSQRIRDPVYAATAFYRALTAVPGWADLPVTVAAQQVQRSATPTAYAKHESLATRIITTLTAQRCLDTALAAATSSPAAATAIAYARAQLGLPYQWGGDGPAAGDVGFDCSGLTQAARPRS